MVLQLILEMILSVTPLHYACLYGDSVIIKFLIKNGANVTAKDNYNKSVFFYAISSNNFEAIEILINNNADINAHNNEGKTPFHYACIYSNIEMMQFLIDRGAYINIIDKKIQPLHITFVIIGI
ncbi:MAG: ankyrin repeat domain-containing protein [Candidatus Midichloria sp.]|nr:MAG: ankyrin repeat domain-containing protein [Candidatus Midichloria sp.]